MSAKLSNTSFTTTNPLNAINSTKSQRSIDPTAGAYPAFRAFVAFYSCQTPVVTLIEPIEILNFTLEQLWVYQCINSAQSVDRGAR